MIRLLIALLITIVSAAHAVAETRVIDGDTLIVDDVRIRIEGLSCDEAGTPMGDAQTKFLAQWMSWTEVECTTTGAKSFNREIGSCQINGTDLGRGMIVAAYCQPCRRYDREGKYADLPVTAVVPKYCNKRGN